MPGRGHAHVAFVYAPNHQNRCFLLERHLDASRLADLARDCADLAIRDANFRNRVNPWYKSGSADTLRPDAVGHYADFDAQVRAVLGPGKSGEGRFEDAARYLEKLFLDGLKP